MTAGSVIVRAVGLGKEFGGPGSTSVCAVRPTTLDLQGGELALITGPSGSGKTTLLSLLGGLIAPTCGEVELAGEALGGLSQSRLAEHRLRAVGFLFQSIRLIDALSTVENVELPLNLAGVVRPESERRARSLLEDLGLGGRLHFRPRALSGGEQQRAALARALANDPPLILADEPTGSLDAKAGRQVIELLRTATRERGKAVLVTSHDPRIRPYADRIWTMEDGLLQPERV
jgi:putative ABC transport system ATP-binding protein